MYKFIFKNSDQAEILLGPKPYFVESIEGFDGAPVDLQMQKAPYQDGETLIDQVFEPRDLTINLTIFGESKKNVYENRRRLLKYLNPKLGIGTLTWYREDGEFAIGSVRDELTFLNTDIGFYWQKATLELRAPDPSFYNPSEVELVLASFTGGFELPFSFPIQFGTVGKELTINNEGDINAPIFVSMKGPLKTPVLENITTGEKITVTKDILSGETLEINTAFGQKSVTIVEADGTRSNAFHYVSPDSDLWQLIPGENLVTYAATEESGDAAVTLTFFHRYEAI